MKKDKVTGGKVRELRGARRTLSMDMAVAELCDRSGVKIRTVSWGPNDPQIIPTGKSDTWYSPVTLDYKVGGGGGIMEKG